MEITTRSLWTLIHGMGFGALYLLACTGAIVGLYQHLRPARENASTPSSGRPLGLYLSAMAVLAWLSVLSGTYIVYPWYRTPAPPGTRDLTAYPRALLLANPSSRAWHSIGMEWKEHVAWLVPIAITMSAFVVLRFGRHIARQPQIRVALQVFVVSSMIAAGIAGFFGAMLDKAAPVEGGTTLQFVKGEQQ